VQIKVLARPTLKILGEFFNPYNVSAMLRSYAVAGVAFVVVAMAQDRPTFRTDVSQVHVDAEVLTEEGRIVAGLSRGDFRVFDEAQEQAIVGFAGEEQPLQLILLFDVSGSMRTQVMKVSAAARQALHELREGDRVSVMAFNDQTFLGTPFTGDPESIELDIQDVLKLRFGGGTLIQQAVDDAAVRMMQEGRTHRRRAILIIADNVGAHTRREMSVAHHLWQADVVLSGLLVKPGLLSRRPFHVSGGMEHLAEMTGGHAIPLDDAASAFTEMMHRIRSRYSLYYPTPEGKVGSFRSIRVELSPDAQTRFPEARVYARRGYRLMQP
jgi:VWFA-related protein